MDLCEIASYYTLKTDKYSGYTAGHTYLPYYEKLFSSYKNKSVKLLEVGVLVGESLKLWSYYFKKGTIYGMDIFCREWDHIAESACDFETVKTRLSQFKNVRLINANCQNRQEIDNHQLPEFDIIIDDGPHTLEAQLTTFSNLKHKLKIGGVYIIEDVKDENIKYIQNEIIGCKVLNLQHEKNDLSNNLIIYERAI